jgi:hypothetical protein
MLWFQSKTVAGVIVTMASALERVSVGCFQGFVGLPMTFLPHVKAVDSRNTTLPSGRDRDKLFNKLS